MHVRAKNKIAKKLKMEEQDTDYLIKLRFTYSEEFRLFIEHALEQVFQDNNTVERVVKERKQEKMNMKLEELKKLKLKSNHAQGNHLGENIQPNEH